MNKRRWVYFTLIILLVLAFFPAGATPTSLQVEDLATRLQFETHGTATIAYHSETGMVRYIGTQPGKPIPRPGELSAGATPEMAARYFMGEYGPLFGIKDQASELAVMRMRTVDGGRSFVRFQQVHQGVPVLGGELIVQLDRDGNVLSANGEALPGLGTSTTPTLSADVAQQKALEVVAHEYDLDVASLTATKPELWIFNQALMGGAGPRVTSLVWRTEVTPLDLSPIRELVLVEAHTGFIALHFNQVDTAKNRLTYDAQNSSSLPGVLRRSEGQGPYGDADVDNAHDFAGATYDFYFSNHGRDSLNNAGMALESTTHFCPNILSCPYQNAFWNGARMVYGEGFSSADDVVGHELTHGVTDYESSLFYYYQSGAINEAFSDIWGEFVDLTNVQPGDTAGVRWLIGEDLSIGAFRSMSDPTLYGDPDKMTSANYYCGEDDGGGVHTNSGVANKAAYLMADGGTFNGKTVSPLGITKTAKIFYEVQTNFFTSASDYQDLYYGLQQACTNLVGTGGITTADCDEVKDAVEAVEMELQNTSCTAAEAPVCTSGSPVYLFNDNLENIASGNWTSSATSGSNTFFYPQNSHPYTGFDATYATSGIYNIWGYDQPSAADFNMRMTSSIALPPGSTPYLHFKHAYGFEDSGGTTYDGGVVEYSTNAGSTWTDAGSLFSHNGYNGTINSASNPLNGQQAFVNDSFGYGSSRLNLSTLAGQSVRFRFRIGTNSSPSTDDYGWFIDDVKIYTCSAVPLNYVYLPLTSRSSSSTGGGWTTIVSEDFEGAFPGPWTLADDNLGDGQHLWGKRNCRVYAGSYSGWGVGGGTAGSALPCGSNYPDNAGSWMIYGPFSLTGAAAAEMNYKTWIDTESGYDFVCHLASIDGTIFDGWCTTGYTAGWYDISWNLITAGYANQPNVWIALYFYSDFAFNHPEGGYVDNILVRKCNSGCTLASSPVQSLPAGVAEIPFYIRLDR